VRAKIGRIKSATVKLRQCKKNGADPLEVLGID
jgi:hypothetical protein